MIRTLTITILIEWVICLLYAVQRKKPIWPILFTSLPVNIITQALLSLALSLFFQHYLATLLIAEILIWLMEALLYYGLRWNQLSKGEAVFLSFITNLSSFGIGWFLPV